MPLHIFATTSAPLRAHAEAYNDLESKLLATPPDTTEHAQIQKEMDEARRLFNLGGGSSASDPAVDTTDENYKAPDGYELQANGRLSKPGDLTPRPIPGYPKLLSDPTTNQMATSDFSVANPDGTFSKPDMIVHNSLEEKEAIAKGFTEVSKKPLPVVAKPTPTPAPGPGPVVVPAASKPIAPPPPPSPHLVAGSGAE